MSNPTPSPEDADREAAREIAGECDWGEDARCDGPLPRKRSTRDLHGPGYLCANCERTRDTIKALAAARAAGAREEGNRRYNAGLDTAMRLVRECGGELVETLIAGLECSKYPIMVAKPDPTTPKEAR